MILPPKEIAFHCPLCHGPLIAPKREAGHRTDCPHCHQAIYVPTGAPVVDKNTYEEPRGLRRILQEVRDQEWESMRRKLRVAKAQTSWLEEELRRMREDLATQALAEPAGADRLAAETAQRQQHQRELAALREELAASRKEAALFHGELLDARRALDEAERQATEAREELSRLKAQRAGRRTSPFHLGAALSLA